MRPYKLCDDIWQLFKTLTFWQVVYILTTFKVTLGMCRFYLVEIWNDLWEDGE